MVRATIFVSALFALVATVAAAPHSESSLIGDLNFQDLRVISADDLRIDDVIYDVPILSNILTDIPILSEDTHKGYNHGHLDSEKEDHHGHYKRAAPAGTVRIARQNKQKPSKEAAAKMA